MNRAEAITKIVALWPDRLPIFANGLISRFGNIAVGHRPAFYMLGSMSLAPSIALGISLIKDDAPISVIDGDGNLLMDLSALAAIGALKQNNIFHFCLNNELYGSTGGQPTIAQKGLFSKCAKDAGYAESFLVHSEAELDELAERTYGSKGAMFFELVISRSDSVDPPRVSLSCSEIALTVEDWLKTAPA
jgi:thiamine pyrophosphate-dependent acetolactate synthase large subunit-like protein